MVVKPRQSTAEMLGCFTQNAFEKSQHPNARENPRHLSSEHGKTPPYLQSNSNRSGTWLGHV